MIRFSLIILLLSGSPGMSEELAAPVSFQDFLKVACDGDFTIRASVSPDPLSIKKGEARLAFHWQADGSGYYLAVGSAGARLFKVVKGAASGLSPWLRWQSASGKELDVFIQRRSKTISVIAGDKAIATVSDNQFSAGKIGGSTSGPELTWKSVRLQKVARISFADDFMREPTKGGVWKPVEGTWSLQGTRGEPKVPGVGMTANPFAYRARPGKNGKALCVTGHWFWDSYAIRASVKPEAPGEVGLVAYYRDPGNYLLYRCTSGLATGTQQLVAVRNGTETILAEVSGGCEVGQWLWLELRALPGKVIAYADGQLVCQADSDLFGQGTCGLYGAGPNMSSLFDDVQAESVSAGEQPAPFPNSNLIRAHFLKDRFLRLWAENGPSWERRPGEEFWHKSLFFGEPSVKFATKFRPPVDSSFWSTICATGPKADSGYTLKMEPGKKKSYQFLLERDGKQVSITSSQAGAKPKAGLLFQQKGSHVIAEWNGKQVLDYTDPAPLRGRKVGYGLAGWFLPPEKVAATCANVTDYTFSSAPVQWRTARGTWETEPHWACTGRGAHFLGMDTGAAILWSKERFRGDLVVEAYLTNAEYPAHVLVTPRNLNLTICGDGANPGSGYTFMLGGQKGKEVRVLRGSRELSRSAFKTHRKSSHNEDIWFQLRIQKIGGAVKFFIDDRLVADCLDPKPLDEGHLAIWTYGTGVVLGRVRIWYEEKGAWQPVPEPVLRLAEKVEKGSTGIVTEFVQPTPIPKQEPPKEIVNDFEESFGSFSTRGWPDAAILMLDPTTAAGGKRSLAVINRSSGGRFSAWALNDPLDVASFPQLSFDYRLPEDVKVNLYAKLGGRWHEIGFAAPQGSKPCLGAINGIVADDKWHHAVFNFQKALKATPNAPVKIEGLTFASPDDFLMRCGLAGNPLGSTFHLDNFRLGPE